MRKPSLKAFAINVEPDQPVHLHSLIWLCINRPISLRMFEDIICKAVSIWIRIMNAQTSPFPNQGSR